MNVQQKEIVLLPATFSDLSETKLRPALIVSNDPFNEISKDCVAVPLTSVIREESFSILIEQKDLANGKLLKPSRARVDKIFSVEKSLIKLKIGKLRDQIFDKVKEEINNLL